MLILKSSCRCLNKAFSQWVPFKEFACRPHVPRTGDGGSEETTVVCGNLSAQRLGRGERQPGPAQASHRRGSNTEQSWAFVLWLLPEEGKLAHTVQPGDGHGDGGQDR